MRTKNPILWRELLHQRRSIPRSIQIIDSVGIVAVVIVLVLMLLGIMLSDLESSNIYNSQLIIWVQVISWFIHALTSIRAIFAGTDVIRRDGSSPNWDDLKLVNVSPMRFLLGKWWAAFYRVRGWMVALGIIQLALVGNMVSSNPLYKYNQALYYCNWALKNDSSLVSQYCDITQDTNFQDWLKWSGLAIPLAASCAVVFSIFEVMTSTAIGIAAGLVFRGNLLSPLPGIFMRFFPVIFFSLWPESSYGLTLEILAWRWNEYTWFSLADGGTTALMRLTNLGYTSYSSIGIRGIDSIPLALIASVAFFVVLFLGSMVVSWLVLRFSVLHVSHR